MCKSSSHEPGTCRSQRRASPEPRIVSQLRAAPAPPVTHARWVKPPCPPPEGSRPTVIRHGHIELDYDRGNLADTGAAVAITLFRPGDNQAVLVAAADPAAVEARLGPDLGGSTASCVLARL